jgi:hypothetical protein
VGQLSVLGQRQRLHPLLLRLQPRLRVVLGECYHRVVSMGWMGEVTQRHLLKFWLGLFVDDTW